MDFAREGLGVSGRPVPELQIGTAARGRFSHVLATIAGLSKEEILIAKRFVDMAQGLAWDPYDLNATSSTAQMISHRWDPEQQTFGPSLSPTLSFILSVLNRPGS